MMRPPLRCCLENSKDQEKDFIKISRRSQVPLKYASEAGSIVIPDREHDLSLTEG
jgi:hypothetical protein